MKKFLYFCLSFFFCVSLFAQDTISQSQDIAVAKDSLKHLLDASDQYYSSGNYKKSMDVNIKILNLAFEKNDPNLIHKGYRFLAYDYLALGDSLAARDNFLKSERYAKLSKNDTATAKTYMDLANLYSSGNHDHILALEYHDKSIELFKKIGDSIGLAKAHYNSAITAFYNKDYHKGYIHLMQAQRLADLENDRQFAAGINNMYADYYKERGKFTLAKEYLYSTINIAKTNDISIELEEAYLTLSKILFIEKKYKKAYEAQEKYFEQRELNMEVMKSAASNMTASKFQLEEYKKDAAAAENARLLQAEIAANKNRLNNLLIVICLGGLLMFVILAMAYRKRKELYQALKEKNKEYLAAKEHSEQLAQAKSNFFSTVSHELRTPLYGVIGLSTILLEDEKLKSHKKDLKSLKFSADYLLALINDVLQINKLDSKKVEDDESTINIREFIESIVSSFEYMRLQNKNKLDIEVDQDVPVLLSGNSIRLSQVLMNLIGNACKFTEDGVVSVKISTLELTETSATLQFVVKDTGIGIPKEKQKGIFNEFQQVDALHYNYQGTGLGLPIVKKLLRLSNSEIALESELGEGSKFTFPFNFNIPEQVPQIEEFSPVDTHILKGKKILIVEDNRINQIVTKKILEKHDILCQIAENGEQAVSKVRKDSFDLVLMDINMPVMNGMDATKLIRKFNKSLPIVALTAVEVEEIRYNIYNAGMNDIIVKPYDATKFIQIILKNCSQPAKTMAENIASA